jgi:hypothetical protein
MRESRTDGSVRGRAMKRTFLPLLTERWASTTVGVPTDHILECLKMILISCVAG